MVAWKALRREKAFKKKALTRSSGGKRTVCLGEKDQKLGLLPRSENGLRGRVQAKLKLLRAQVNVKRTVHNPMGLAFSYSSSR